MICLRSDLAKMDGFWGLERWVEEWGGGRHGSCSGRMIAGFTMRSSMKTSREDHTVWSWGKSAFGHIQEAPSLPFADRETGVTHYLFISFGRVPFQFLFYAEYRLLAYGVEQQFRRNLDFDVMDRKKIKCKRMASCAMRVDKTLSLANY